MQLESRLDRTVIGKLRIVNSDGKDLKFILQSLAQGFGEVGHFLKCLRRLLPEPFPNLLRPKFFLTYSFKIGNQSGQRFFPNILHKAKVEDGSGSFAIFVSVLLIDKLTKAIGTLVSWLTLILVMVMVGDVALRYLFSTTSAASFELEWHLFAGIFLLGAAYTLQQDKHVRVDVFYHRFSKKTQGWINLIGTIFLLLPFCSIAFYESLSFVEASFSVRETSADPQGLPARYIIKSAIPLGFLLLGLQGISELLKSIKKIGGANA